MERNKIDYYFRALNLQIIIADTADVLHFLATDSHVPLLPLM